MPPKVFIIILNYNGIDCLSDSLKAVFKSNYTNFEVILVDNASTDGSFEQAKRLFSKAHFIKNNQNLGFGRGHNVGIRFALEKMADYVLLLNNDAFIETETISKLVQFAEKNKDAGIISPVIYGEKGEIWFAGGSIDWKNFRTTHETEIKKQDPYKTGFVTGCSMLIRKEVFEKIGIFDENIFLYYEDADICARAICSGFDLFVVPLAKVIHRERSEQNTNKKTYWLVFSGIYFFRKHAKFFRRIYFEIHLFLRKIKNNRDLKKKDAGLAAIVRKAYQDYDQAKF